MNKKMGIVIIAVSLVMITMLGCSKKDSMMEQSANYADKSAPSAGSGSKNSAADSATATVVSQTETKSQEKKIIQTGQITIIVEDIKKSSSDIRATVNDLGGYMESENIMEYNSDARVRIPAEKLDVFVEYVTKNFDVRNQQMSAQDITDTYVDNDSRLLNIKAQEAQILEVMKSAKTVEEILKVQNELFRVRSDIEAMQGRKKVWDRDVNFSTVTVSASKKQSAIESKVKILTGSEFGKAISKGFSKSTTSVILFFENLIIFILSNIIVLLILVVVGYFVYKKFLTNKK